MIDTILFDLDGTLLPLDLKHFTTLYFQEMGAFFQGVIAPEELTRLIWTATKAMVANLEHRTNEAVFMESFARLIHESASRDLKFYQEKFQNFYAQRFIKTRDAVADAPAMRRSVSFLQSKGYQLVIATNPIFPYQAILQRILWAGFQPRDFSYISCYERNHYCKPHLEFYQEVLGEIGKDPSRCLMVGNDVAEDMVASQTGMKTFLITDYLIPAALSAGQGDYQGTYQDFYRFVTGELQRSPLGETGI